MVTTRFTQDWGPQFLHFTNDSDAVGRIGSAATMLLELSWYGESRTYFRFSLSGSSAALKRESYAQSTDGIGSSSVSFIASRESAEPSSRSSDRLPKSEVSMQGIASYFNTRRRHGEVRRKLVRDELDTSSPLSSRFFALDRAAV